MATLNEFETLKIKHKSATKIKINKEKELCRARNKERSLNEELSTLKSEIEFLKEQLEEVKVQISQTNHHIAMIRVCSASEKCKKDAHLANLERHQKGFHELFNKERESFEIRMKEIKTKEAEEADIARQREKKLAEKRDTEAREAARVEAECEALDVECTVLKKKNNAIMLKLRRKLLETEKIRRELTKNINSDNTTKTE